MLTLLTFRPSFDMPSHSPYCAKAIALLNLSGQAWQSKFLADPSKMPMGRLPVLKTAEGQLIPDSAHIQAYLEAQGAEFNAGLSEQEKATSHALMRMVEHSLTPGVAHDRWLRDDCWPIVREVFFAEMPALLRRPISKMIRAKVRRGLTSQGIAQYSEEDRLDRLGKDIDAIETVLGDKPYLFGDEPTAADATVVPTLGMIQSLPCDTDLRRLVRGNDRLVAYIERAKDRLYPV